jgi:hypothetical protein
MASIMKAHGRRTKCTELVLWRGKMGSNIMANLSMTSVKEKVLLPGLTAENTSDNGKQESNTEKDHI